MELPIPNSLKKLWDAWNLQSCILISFSLQVILVLIAFLRKRTRSKPVVGLIWLAYLLADWIAPVAIGLISKSNCGRKGNEELMAFWASFLLLHLGGPDTITSFALEDNEFWLRHLIGLILQFLATAYIIYKTLPKNKLLVPTIMVFFVGTVKYVERTRALYLASLDKFGGSVLPAPNPGPDYEELMETYSSMRSVQVSTHVEVMPTPEVGTNIPKDSISTGKLGEPLDEMQLLQEAHRLFERFKGLIVGLLLSSKDRDMSRDFFLTITPNEAFRLIECELSFMYEVLHTKVVVIRCQIWYFLRFVSFIAILVALLFFLFKNQHELDHNVHKFDIILTYVLLGGALGLEALSVLMLILSDWTLIALKSSCSKLIQSIILKRRKWSGSISQYDMISYCLNGPPTWVYKLADYVGVGGILDKMKILYFSHSEKFRDDMKSFIFNELRLKSLTANNFRAAMDASSKRGDWALLQTSSYFKLKWSIEEYQYAESLLIWHIATELCYQKNKPSTHHSDSSSINHHRETCKLLSDYMFYLLKMKHIMMAPVLGNWKIVFQDTCAEAKRFFHKYSIWDNNVDARERILKVDAKYRPVAVKGSKSKSVFFDGCILAQQLSALEIDKWKLMSRVWVELMSYAAINCRPNVHAQQPSRGGELLTFIWLLMNHLGLGTQFYQQERQAGAKMVPLK